MVASDCRPPACTIGSTSRATDDEVIYGGYLFLAGPTPLGTFTLGVGGTGSEWNVWLSIGKPISTGTILDDGLFR